MGPKTSASLCCHQKLWSLIVSVHGRIYVAFTIHLLFGRCHQLVVVMWYKYNSIICVETWNQVSCALVNVLTLQGVDLQGEVVYSIDL